MATTIVASGHTRSIEHGPYGGTKLNVGDEVVGESLDAPADDYQTGWGAGRIADATVAQVAHLLARGKLWLPAEPRELEIPMAHLSQVGQRGLDSQMFISAAHKGPFTRVVPSPTATYPALWSHDAKNENGCSVHPTSSCKFAQTWRPEQLKFGQPPATLT